MQVTQNLNFFNPPPPPPRLIKYFKRGKRPRRGVQLMHMATSSSANRTTRHVSELPVHIPCMQRQTPIITQFNNPQTTNTKQ